MESTRAMLPQEVKLISLLANKADINLPLDWEESILVKPMDDGGMGSLQLIPASSNEIVRLFGKRVSEYQFKDEDGTDVIASLNVDKEGSLLELDMWKTDYSSLINYPKELRQ